MNIENSIVLFVLVVTLIGIKSAPIKSGDYSKENEDSDNENPEEMGEYFEGDILLNDRQFKIVNGKVQSQLRTAKLEERYRWNSTIAYAIDPVFSTLHHAHLLLGMAGIEKVTCLKFKPKTETDVDYISFKGLPTGCYSFVGRQGGENIINFKISKPGSGCFKHGTIIHEIIHTLGFYHMQSATDRDEYIKIVWDNIKPAMKSNFKTYDDSTITNFGFPYDYSSIMHYSAKAFTANGKETIIPLDPKAPKIGQRVAMSELDIARINTMFCAPSENGGEPNPEVVLAQVPEPEPPLLPEPEAEINPQSGSGSEQSS